jgi:hypothetical protein
VDPSYTGAVAVGNASHPFKTFAAAWFSLGKGLLKAGVVMNIKPVSMMHLLLPPQTYELRLQPQQQHRQEWSCKSSHSA